MARQAGAALLAAAGGVYTRSPSSSPRGELWIEATFDAGGPLGLRLEAEEEDYPAVLVRISTGSLAAQCPELR